MSEENTTDILHYLVNNNLSIDENYRCDAICEPLYWFVRQYCTKNSVSMAAIADSLNISDGALTKKLNINSHQHRPLFFGEVKKLCSTMGFSISSIIFFYQNKEIFQNKITKDNFSDLKELLSVESEKFLDFSALSSTQSSQMASKAKRRASKAKEDIPPEDNSISPLSGKWYFYFPSSDSSIINDRKKEILKKENPPINNPEIIELYDLYSQDHIYSGTFTVRFKDGQFCAVLKYMTDPLKLSVLTYEGTISELANTHAVATTLSNLEGNDIINMIIDTLAVEKSSRYIMAAVLLLSRNKVEEKHRPCALRMILSRNKIEYGSSAYNILLSNLMLNDKVIRIDDQGYNELKKYQEWYASPALNAFIQKYPTIGNMDVSNYIEVHSCAYINESLIESLQELDDKDRQYLEALLRLHSIAPWYAKTKSSKTNKLLKKFNDTKIE